MRLQTVVCGLLFAAVLAPAVRGGETAEMKVEIRTCAEGTGTVVKGGGCWIIDVAEKQSFYQYEICAGLVLDGGILVAGAEAGVMVCATYKIPIELARDADRKAWNAVARLRLAEELAKPRVRRQITAATGRPADGPVQVGPLRRADDATRRSLKDALERAK